MKTAAITHRLALRWRCLAGALVSLLGMGLGGLAKAVVIDVSEVVNGPGQSTIALQGPITPCTSACKHALVASAGFAGAYAPFPEPQIASVWGPAFLASVPTLQGLSQSLGVWSAVGTRLDGGAVGVAQRAAVDFDWMGQGSKSQLSVQTWKTGSGIATLSYAVQVNTPTGGPKPTYLSFEIPQQASDFQLANEVLSSGGVVPHRPLRSHSRAAVDIFVDGLPVWSGEFNRLFSKRLNGFFPVDLEWGRALDGSRVDLYLGNLPGGSTRNVAVNFRTELHVEGGCYLEQVANPQVQRCHAQRQTLSIPSALSNPGGAFSSIRPDIQVYTR